MGKIGKIGKRGQRPNGGLHITTPMKESNSRARLRALGRGRLGGGRFHRFFCRSGGMLFLALEHHVEGSDLDPVASAFLGVIERLVGLRQLLGHIERGILAMHQPDAHGRADRTAIDFLGRLGGEEFAAVLSDTSRDKAVAVAERIRESFAKAAREVEGRPVCATVSIGLVHCQDAALDVAEQLAQADQALYYAKERGRNRVEVASLDMVLKRKEEYVATSAASAEPVAAKSAAA